MATALSSRKTWFMLFRTVLTLILICLFVSPVLAQSPPKVQWLKSLLSQFDQVVYSPDGKMLAACGAGPQPGLVNLYNASTGALLQSLSSPDDYTGTLDCLAFSRDGKTLATGGYAQENGGPFQGILEVYNLSTGKRLLALKPAAASFVLSVALSSDGATLADCGLYADSVGAYHCALETWDLSTGKRLHQLNTSATSDINGVAFSPNGRILAVGGDAQGSNGAYHGVLEFWNASSGALLRTLPTASRGDINAIAFSPDGKLFADGGYSRGSTGSTGILELWNVASGALLHALPADTRYTIDAVTFSPDSKTLADGGRTRDSTGVYHGVIDFWNASSGNDLAVIASSSEDVDSLAYSPDGKTIVDSGYLRGTSEIEWWNLASGTLLRSLRGDAYFQTNTVAFAPNGRVLVEGGETGVVGFISPWSVGTASQAGVLNTSSFSVRTLAFSPNGRIVVDGGDSGVVEWWNLPTDTLLRSLSLPATEIVTSVAFSPDGKTLAIGGYNGGGPALDLWSVSSGTHLRSLNTSALRVISVAFSPDGKTLASGGFTASIGNSGLLELWDPTTGKLKTTLSDGVTSGVYTVAFSPDGKTLAAGGYYHEMSGQYNGVLDLWDVASGTRTHTLKTAANGGAFSVAFSPDGKTLAAGGIYLLTVGGVLELWDVSTGAEIVSYDQLTADLTSLAFSPTGEYLGYCCGDGLLVLASNPVYVPPVLQSVKLSATSVTGGKTLAATVALNAPAPTQGAIVSLVSSDPTVAVVPASVGIGSAATSALFTVQTQKVTASKTVTITTGYAGKTIMATLTVHP